MALDSQVFGRHVQKSFEGFGNNASVTSRRITLEAHKGDIPGHIFGKLRQEGALRLQMATEVAEEHRIVAILMKAAPNR